MMSVEVAATSVSSKSAFALTWWTAIAIPSGVTAGFVTTGVRVSMWSVCPVDACQRQADRLSLRKPMSLLAAPIPGVTGRLFALNTAICSSTDEHGYYSWTTAQSTAQNYDIYVQYKMPSDFSAFTSDSAITMDGWRTSSSDTVSLALEQANGSQCGSTTSMATGTAAWTTTTFSGTITGCTIAANDTVTFQVHLVAGAASDYARAGTISFSYYAAY